MKEYVKPRLYCESFALSQHIAGCSLTLNKDGITASGTISNVPSWADTDGVQDGIVHSDSWFVSGSVCQTSAEAFCYTNGALSNANINS